MTYTIKTKSLPDLAKQFEAFKLKDKLEAELMKNTSSISISLLHALLEKEPLMKIFASIKEMAEDNYKIMEHEIGTELLNQIINF